MRLGILADIHGNADALYAVLASAKREGVARLLVAGDLVGYYYEPARVLALLDEWDWVMVRGNHEDMLARWLRGFDRDVIAGRYGSGIDVAAHMLSKEQQDLLTFAPTQRILDIEGRSVLLCHGSPWDADAYVYPDASTNVKDLMLSTGNDAVVFGHTHIPVLWRSPSSRAFNPGSVGQPRDWRPGACWAIWNTATDEVELRREPYDSGALIAECHRRDPGISFLRDVLVRTRA
jgi:putative phosphoesterase